jgi:hypothetical protein
MANPAIEQAQKAQEKEREKATNLANRQVYQYRDEDGGVKGEEGKEGKERKEIGEYYIEPKAIDGLVPDYVKDLGGCRVEISLDNNTVIIADPGHKHVGSVGMYGSQSPEEQAQVVSAVARAAVESKVYSIRNSPDFGTEAGQMLPSPAKFEAEHRAAWREWKKQKRHIDHVNLLGRVKSDDYVDEMEPDYPETKLEQLLMEEWPGQMFERCFEGLLYVILGHDNRYINYRKSRLKAEASSIEVTQEDRSGN